MIGYLASLYQDLVAPPGIPWDGLIAQGRGITDDSYDGTYMDTMLQEGTKFLNVLGTLNQEFRDKYRSIQANDARKAMAQMMALVNQTGADVWEATKKGEWGAAVHFPRSLAVDALATFAANAMNGAYLHYDGVMESTFLAGGVKPAEVMTHASSVVRTFQTFVDLDKNGHLNQFKQNEVPPMSGLGNPVLAGWALAALGIVVVLGLCYLLYIVEVASPIQDKVIAYCDKISKSGGTTADMQTCVTALQNIQKNGNADILGFMGTILKPVVLVAAVGVAAYLGFLFLPGMLKKAAA